MAIKPASGDQLSAGALFLTCLFFLTWPCRRDTCARAPLGWRILARGFRASGSWGTMPGRSCKALSSSDCTSSIVFFVVIFLFSLPNIYLVFISGPRLPQATVTYSYIIKLVSCQDLSWQCPGRWHLLTVSH